MDIPAEAIRRLEKLRGLADDTRAAYVAAQQRFLDERQEAGRLEADLQRHGRGQRLHVEGDDPTPFFVVEDKRQDFRSDPSGRVIECVPREVPVKGDAATLAGRLVVEARAKVRAATRRRDELSERLQILGQVAKSCEDLLRARGWKEGSTPYGEVTGVGAGGLRVAGEGP